MAKLRQGNVIKWFALEPATFVFANHGGKSGTITKLEFCFVPHRSFAEFYESFVYHFSSGEPKYTISSPPITIEEGDNQYIDVSSTIYTIDWKEKALVEFLYPNLKLDEIIAKALEKSKERFERFCDYLEKSQEIGRVSCKITLTKGRFSTRITSEKLLENEPVAIHCDKATSSLRSCLRRWENLSPTKTDLSDKMKRDLEDLIRELKDGLKVSEIEVDGGNIDKSRLKVNIWKRVNEIRDSDDRKIRWFLIRLEEGLEEDLRKLYEKIGKYNNTINEALQLGDLRTEKHFRTINVERRRLHSNIEKIVKKAYQLHSKYVS